MRDAPRAWRRRRWETCPRSTEREEWVSLLRGRSSHWAVPLAFVVAFAACVARAEDGPATLTPIALEVLGPELERHAGILRTTLREALDAQWNVFIRPLEEVHAESNDELRCWSTGTGTQWKKSAAMSKVAATTGALYTLYVEILVDKSEPWHRVGGVVEARATLARSDGPIVAQEMVWTKWGQSKHPLDSAKAAMVKLLGTLRLDRLPRSKVQPANAFLHHD